jgi:hypothetical protein
MPRMGNRSGWLSLREAADLIGHVSDPGWGTIDGASNEAVTNVLNLLWNAIDTKRVTVLLHYLRDPDHPHTLTIEELHHPSFRMDIVKGVIFLGELPDDPWACEINKQELMVALPTLGISGVGSADRQRSCATWLEGLMKFGPKERTRDTYYSEARERFHSLTAKEFDRAWKQAKSVSRDPHGWGRPGAPKPRN